MCGGRRRRCGQQTGEGNSQAEAPQASHARSITADGGRRLWGRPAHWAEGFRLSPYASSPSRCRHSCRSGRHHQQAVHEGVGVDEEGKPEQPSPSCRSPTSGDTRNPDQPEEAAQPSGCNPQQSGYDSHSGGEASPGARTRCGHRGLAARCSPYPRHERGAPRCAITVSRGCRVARRAALRRRSFASRRGRTRTSRARGSRRRCSSRPTRAAVAGSPRR